ncbi:MAG: hypothetical protein HY870_12865 [Chloroflexi bacterium]|nr:hypothetical protein [Chloroflexota bacterium]
MQRPLKVFPIGGEEPTDWVEGWNDTHPDTPLQIVAAPDQCQAYLACDLAADVIDAEIEEKHLPDRPVIWPPFVFNSCGDFMREDRTPYDHLLHTIYGSVTRAGLLATLREAKAALDDASSVVDASEGETYAYEHDLCRLSNLIEQLEGGAFIIDETDFADTPAAPARLPAIGEWVTVYSKNNWPAQAFTGRVSGVRGDRVTVIDQADDAWDVDLDQIELAESDDEADDETDDEPEGDDVCDNCFASDVVCEQTCACVKTLCVECATDNDGLCGECAANAEETESDEAAADTDAVERVVDA